MVLLMETSTWTKSGVLSPGSIGCTSLIICISPLPSLVFKIAILQPLPSLDDSATTVYLSIERVVFPLTVSTKNKTSGLGDIRLISLLKSGYTFFFLSLRKLSDHSSMCKFFIVNLSFFIVVQIVILQFLLIHVDNNRCHRSGSYTDC